MKVVGVSGERYLIFLGSRAEESDETQYEPAQIYDAQENFIYPPQAVGAITKFGGWEEYTGPQGTILDAAQKAQQDIAGAPKPGDDDPRNIGGVKSYSSVQAQWDARRAAKKRFKFFDGTRNS